MHFSHFHLKVTDPQSAGYVKVVPTPNNGYPEIIKLHNDTVFELHT